MKKIAIVPTLLTLGNAVCGFASIAYAAKIDGTEATAWYFALCGWLIVVAMIFDAVDGYVARLARSTSHFGAELDSLCDAVSFGAAPAFLLLRLGPSWDQPMLHRALAVVATLYVVCALLRLARYNVESVAEANTNKKFRGLPSPGAAGCLASLAILRGQLSVKWPGMDLHLIKTAVELWAVFGTLIVALLMVSAVPYPHLTKQILRGKKHFNHLVQVILGLFILVLIQELVLVPVFWIYALGVLTRHLVVRALRQQPMSASAHEGITESLPH